MASGNREQPSPSPAPSPSLSPSPEPSPSTSPSPGTSGASGTTAGQRPTDVEPFLAGCAFPAAPGVPYPRALPVDAGRLPADTWATACIPVGVRLELMGEAEAIEIEYETATTDLGYRGAGAGTTFTSWRGQSVIDDVPAVLGRGRVTLRVAANDAGALRESPRSDESDRTVVTLPEGMRPSILAVGGVGGTVRPAPPQPRWLCYGDSIAEGWAASNPGRAWPAVAGRRYGLDVVNLGYAGAARGEMVSAEEIAGLPADVISLSYGTNCWTRIQHSAEQVGAGLDAFVDLVRTGHPDTPIVVASPVIRPDAEDQQNGLGATLADLRSVIEARIERRCALDPRLHLVRGGDLLTADQLADGVHPGDEGHRVLAEAVGSAVRASLDATTATPAATPDSPASGPRA
ncbi:MAG TPA: GDSL-type esterase/lipase family protein [Acidimicrobiales bacterium]|jgi:lysophospholipase L1-like esterase|nr:GDSL-type esterase/lipase family protein [Acidimicrobiales bacterium]